MSIQSEITRISGNVSDALSAIADKGVTVPSGSNSDDLADLISQITGGSGSGGIIYQDLDGYLHLSEDTANVISIVDELDTAGGTIRTITGVTESGGGGLSYESGSITIAKNTQYLIVTGLGGTPKFIKFIIHDAATNVGDGTLKSVSGIYVMGASMVRATNNAGSGYGYTAFGTEAAWEASTQTVYEDGTNPAAAGQIYATTSGFSVRSYSNSYSFKAGYTFDWQVWY